MFVWMARNSVISNKIKITTCPPIYIESFIRPINILRLLLGHHAPLHCHWAKLIIFGVRKLKGQTISHDHPPPDA